MSAASGGEVLRTSVLKAPTLLDWQRQRPLPESRWKSIKAGQPQQPAGRRVLLPEGALSDGIASRAGSPETSPLDRRSRGRKPLGWRRRRATEPGGWREDQI